MPPFPREGQAKERPAVALVLRFLFGLPLDAALWGSAALWAYIPYVRLTRIIFAPRQVRVKICIRIRPRAWVRVWIGARA